MTQLNSIIKKQYITNTLKKQAEIYLNSKKPSVFIDEYYKLLQILHHPVVQDAKEKIEKLLDICEKESTRN